MRQADGRRAAVVAVIPAWNEEKTVGQVIDAVRASGVVDHVLVVSDGSEDATAAVARAHGAECLEWPHNRGKGRALSVGAEAFPADVYLFLDADLVGLRPSHVVDLVAPVLAREADMTVGVFTGGPAAVDLAHSLAPFLSGQRAVRRRVLEEAARTVADAGFGAELALTRATARLALTVRQVPLRGVTHRLKEEKRGLRRGLAARLRMYWEIVRTLWSLWSLGRPARLR
ncbi:MAG: glycosyltransferase family 2 protein [Clostridia bacterium]|nr:glycosyltransferase family 2 protein [Clostridia bacterium]